MTPLDDQLRETLSARAAVVTPSPDPLAGVEERARGIRRRRVALAVSGAVAVVAAVAIAVPGLVPDREATRVVPGTTPTATAPADPSTWGYRGNAIPAATVDTFSRAWQTRHPGSTLTPLFGQVYEPSATQELVFVAHGPDGDRVGVVRSAGTSTCSACATPRASGAEIVYDEALGTLRELAFVLDGDELARVLVVAAPDTQAIAYRDTSAMASTPLTVLAPGVGTGPVATSRPQPMVSVTRADRGIDEFAPFDRTRTPGNLLTWGVRGTDAVSPSTLDLRTDFAKAFGRSDVDQTNYSPLFVEQTDSGVHYTMGQAWFTGDDKAYSVSYATGGSNGPGFFLGPVTPTSPWGLAFLFGDLPGSATDLLVVVPRPGIGQVSYSPGATGEFQPVAYGRSDLNGVALIDRAKGATTDRLQVLDGDGNLDKPLYRGPVQPLLCGLTECG